MTYKKSFRPNSFSTSFLISRITLGERWVSMIIMPSVLAIAVVWTSKQSNTMTLSLTLLLFTAIEMSSCRWQDMIRQKRDNERQPRMNLFSFISIPYRELSSLAGPAMGIYRPDGWQACASSGEERQREPMVTWRL